MYIHVYVSLCRPWKHHTDTFSITFLGVMGEASVVCGCGCGCVGVGVTHIFSDAAVILHIERKIHMYQSSVGTFCFGRGAATVSRCLSYGILGIDSWPGIQPHIWLIYIWRMRDIWRMCEQLIPGRFSEAFQSGARHARDRSLRPMRMHTGMHTVSHVPQNSHTRVSDKTCRSGITTPPTSPTKLHNCWGSPSGMI